MTVSERKFVEMLRACQRRNPAYTDICVWLINQVSSGAYHEIPLDNLPLGAEIIEALPVRSRKQRRANARAVL